MRRRLAGELLAARPFALHRHAMPTLQVAHRLEGDGVVSWEPLQDIAAAHLADAHFPAQEAVGVTFTTKLPVGVPAFMAKQPGCTSKANQLSLVASQLPPCAFAHNHRKAACLFASGERVGQSGLLDMILSSMSSLKLTSEGLAAKVHSGMDLAGTTLAAAVTGRGGLPK
eukprot:15465241-Alexandrium_andersonii.AAC.1